MIVFAGQSEENDFIVSSTKTPFDDCLSRFNNCCPSADINNNNSSLDAYIIDGECGGGQIPRVKTPPLPSGATNMPTNLDAALSEAIASDLSLEGLMRMLKQQLNGSQSGRKIAEKQQPLTSSKTHFISNRTMKMKKIKIRTEQPEQKDISTITTITMNPAENTPPTPSTPPPTPNPTEVEVPVKGAPNRKRVFLWPGPMGEELYFFDVERIKRRKICTNL